MKLIRESPREPRILEDIAFLAESPRFGTLRVEAEKKLRAMEKTIERLIFRSRAEVDPIEIEYFRGFRQGVMFVLDGLPNEISKEYKRFVEQAQKEADN